MTVSPKRSDIQLSFPETITLDEAPFTVSVTNQGVVSYAFYVQDTSDNCLIIGDAAGEFFPTIPDETCDALAEYIVHPGESRQFGSWDLKRCADNRCLIRELVEPGLYHFSATFEVFAEDEVTRGGVSFTFQEPFTVLPTATANLTATPASSLLTSSPTP